MASTEWPSVVADATSPCDAPVDLAHVWHHVIQPILEPFVAVKQSIAPDTSARALYAVGKRLQETESALRAAFDRYHTASLTLAKCIALEHANVVAFINAIQGRLRTMMSQPKRYSLGPTKQKSIYGKVKVGVDNKTGQRVAIKLTSIAAFKKRPTFEDPFREIDILRFLSRGGGHPNVTRLLDAFEHEEVQWTVLEFCGGGDLWAIVQSQAPLPESRCRDITTQILHGLSFIHSSGIAHMDLSLENVMADDAGTIKIIDFGMAVQIPAGGLLPRVASGIGKIAYRAPEIPFDSFDPVKCDVYSLGVILFIILTGVAPYKVPDASDPQFSLIWTGHLDALIIPNALSPKALSLLSRMMGPPQHRPSIAEILEDPWMKDPS